MNQPMRNQCMKPITLCEYMMGKHLIRLIAFLICMMVSSTSCTKRQPQKPLEKCLNDYRHFTESICGQEDLKVSDFPSVIQFWHSYEDSIFTFIEDSASEIQMQTLSEVAGCSHSILEKLNSVIDTRLHAYTDVLMLQNALARYDFDADIDEYAFLAQSFFASLDTVNVTPTTPMLSERHYLQFLSDYLNRDFTSWYDVLEYMTEEDYLYRQYIDDYLSHSVMTSQQIVADTEEIVGQMMDGSHNGCFSDIELVIFMASRTNRRIIQQADTCLTSIETGKINDAQSGTKAILSALTPFTSFNALLIVVRTDEQRSKLNEIGRRIPRAMRKLEEQHIEFPEPLDSLPNQLLKEYVNFIINQ